MPKRYAFTDESITTEEWIKILELPMRDKLIKLLAVLKLQNGKAVPVKKLPKYFRNSHIEQLNSRFSDFNQPYRVGNAGKMTWTTVLPYEARALKLYKVLVREREGPDIYFNMKEQPNPSHTGRIRLHVLLPENPAKGIFHPELNILSSISVSPTDGFIHLHPTKEELDQIIQHLTQMRNDK